MRTSVVRASIVAAVFLASPQGASSKGPSRQLTFEDRVRAQEAIERVYYSHQVGATRPFEMAVPRDVLERKVDAYLRQSVALEQLRPGAITDDLLRREIDRIASGSLMPERLAEIYHALGDDPFLIRETVGRAALASRLTQRFPTTEELLKESKPLDTARDTWAESTGTPGEGATHGAATSTRLMPLLNEPLSTTCAPNDAWDPGSSSSPRPSKRRVVTAVWTGSLFIIWGGWDGSSGLDTGGRYDPVLDVWSPTTMTDAPSARSGHAAIWTGQEMIVWGGVHSDPGQFWVLNDGGRYDPIADTWTATSIVDAPAPRYAFTSVWTGSQMIVWGGTNSLTYLSTGGRYDPATDLWLPTRTVGAPSPRAGVTGAWTGGHMVVWGGTDDRTGGRYDPMTNTWLPTSLVGAPSPRSDHMVVWTGGRVIVWGGNYGDALDTGAQYDSIADSWSPTSTEGAPQGRSYGTSTWTGKVMIVWGGVGDFDMLNTGGRYDPVLDTWAPTSTTGAPSPRSEFAAAWTGTRLIVWGGLESTSENLLADTGGSYSLDQSADSDLDGFSVCAGDCDDANPDAWSTPGEVRDVVLDHATSSSLTSLTWILPVSPGGTVVVYDTMRSASSADFVTAATCIESGDGADTIAADTQIPPPGGIAYYLVRALNLCPGSLAIGSLGSDSGGTLRAGRTCP